MEIKVGRLSRIVRRPTSSSSFGLARKRVELQLLLAGGLFERTTGGFGDLLFRLALGSLDVAHFPRLENLFPLGLALDDRRIRRIIFRVGEKLLRHILARLGGVGLAVSKLVAVHKGHRIPIE